MTVGSTGPTTSRTMQELRLPEQRKPLQDAAEALAQRGIPMKIGCCPSGCSMFHKPTVIIMVLWPQ